MLTTDRHHSGADLPNDHRYVPSSLPLFVALDTHTALSAIDEFDPQLTRQMGRGEMAAIRRRVSSGRPKRQRVRMGKRVGHVERVTQQGVLVDFGGGQLELVDFASWQSGAVEDLTPCDARGL